MQQVIKCLVYTLLIAVIFTSCGDNVSLQHYYVDNQEIKGFVSQDIPLSLMGIDKSNFTKEQNEAYNSVNKLNFLGYKISDADTKTFKVELAKVKTILSDTIYNNLMEFRDKGNKISVKYIGAEAAEEIVVFGSAKDRGFAIVRILGDDMNPDKIVTLISALQNANVEENQIEDIMNFFF